MTLIVTPDARRALESRLASDPDHRAFRISFAGGCGALGYQLVAAAEPRPGEHRVEVDGLTFFLDFKSRLDLDGARLEIGSSPDEIVIVHDRAVVGGAC